MASIVKKGMSWLGLGPDEYYDEYYDDEEFTDDISESAPRQARPPAVDAEWDEPESGGVRVLSQHDQPRVRPADDVEGGEDPSRPRSVVRALPTSTAKPHVLSPESFNDAQEVGDWFKRRQPVIVNLQALDRDLARRLLDFSSGVAYGLGGTVERVASHVYLLTPADVEVSADDRRRIEEGQLS
jgi:cell division inhibitor SepF